jgi:hypothetical protein
MSDEFEACYFRSAKEFKVAPKGQEYFGVLENYEIGKFDLFGPNVPWYRIKNSSIMPIEDELHIGDNVITKSELDVIKRMKSPCYICESPIDEAEVMKCNTILAAPKLFKLICPSCYEEQKIQRELKETNNADIPV